MAKHILIKPYNLLPIRLVPCGDIKGINRTSQSIFVHSRIPRLSPGSPSTFLSLLLDCSPPCCFRSSSLSSAFRAMLQSLLWSFLMILPVNFRFLYFIIGSVVSCLITVVFFVLLFYPAIRSYEFVFGCYSEIHLFLFRPLSSSSMLYISTLALE